MLNSLFIGNEGGGIISTITQAPQSEEPVVIIGLGGTGVDAITRLKTKLQRQIKPDNEADVKEKGDEPQYNHIKFLGIDADKKWLEGSGLNNSERLNIQNYNYNVIFSEDKLPSLKQQKEMQWMSIDYMSGHLPPNPDGAGAYRQFGRWLTISSASNIKMKLTQVITQACSGRNGGSLNVHIVSGISGGMGAGSFVDVCYITREVIDGLGFNAAKVFGYFVLPDAIISKDAIIASPIKTAANQKNGIASLLEIEHLMNLKDSNEWFEQDYGSFQIKTQHKLVDMCHFVSSTNMNGVPVPNGYAYALNVIGDYILAFISKEQKATPTSTPITMTGNLSNIEADLSGIVPEHGKGYSQNYHIIGSANAEIPTTQMATYLASKLFGKLTISKTMPNETQIEQEFASYLKLSDSTFKKLEKQMVQGASWIPVTEQLVDQYFAQIKNHMNDGILPGAMINQTEDSMKQRKALLIQKRESMEKNVESYVYEAGASSVPGLALNKLIEIIEDPKKGPIYAYGMMNKTGADIFHYLDGRMKYYAKQKQDARDQETVFSEREPSAKKNLGNAGIFGKKQAIRDYAAVLYNMYKWQADAELYEEMEKLMSDLITAFKSINDRYLKPLNKTTKDLIETFEANSQYFNLGNGNQSQDGFTKQLVKFSDIKGELDDEIKKLDSEVETGGILKILTNYPEIWMESEELRLKAKISEYILEKFNPILSGSLESFIRKDLKMETATDTVFANAILTQIIAPFVNASAPIFWTSEPMISDNTKTAHRSILTVPSIENCVCLAADEYKKGNITCEVRKSLINDRIYVLRTISGVPMHAYQGLIQYLGSYESYTDLGLHLYEHNVNWREILTFPYPYSYVPKYTKNADELLKLYDDAEKKGIIYFDEEKAYVKQFGDLNPELLNLDGLKVNGKINEALAEQRKTELQAVLNTTGDSIAINSKGNLPGNSLIKDNFLRFYGIQQAVRKEVEKYDIINKTIKDIDELKEQLAHKDKLKTTFFAAIIGDIFEDDGFNMSYKYVEFGMEKTELLCDNSMPYSGLSKYYQAYYSMCALNQAVQDDITQKANDRLNVMTPKEKMEKLEKLMTMYNPQVIARISQNFEGKLEQQEINTFYQAFIKYLDDLRIQIMMSGALV